MGLSWAIFLLSLFLVLYTRRRQRPPLPPGPSGVPILGALWKHPRFEYWKTYVRWDRESGNKGFIYFHLLGRRMLILNSVASVEDLFVKRSVNYSDRPFPTMAGVLMKREKSMFLSSNTDRLRKYRKLLHQALNSAIAHEYWSIQEETSLTMVDNILTHPTIFLSIFAVDAIMRISFGYTVSRDDDLFVARLEEAVAIGSIAARPGAWLCDSFPILRHLPEWFPGAGFKRKAREWSEILYSQAHEPHEYVKRQLALGTAVPSFTSKQLLSTDDDLTSEERDDLTLWTAGALYTAGADTAIKTFLFLMMLYPDAQDKAQKEVDTLIAREERLPTLKDRKDLPYLEAVLKETMRYHPAIPLGLPHFSRNSDIYEGFSIPAGTTVMANIWAITHDPFIYPNPHTFDPERFLGSWPQPDPRPYVFGLGRRVCSGQYVAENAIWIQMALVLASLQIRKGRDEDGLEIEPDMRTTTGVVSHVKEFQYTIVPRSGKVVRLVKETLHAHS